MVSVAYGRKWERLAREHQAVPFVSSGFFWSARQVRERIIWLVPAMSRLS